MVFPSCCNHVLSTATLMMSVSCGLLAIENKSAPSSLEQTFQFKISDPDPMSATTYSESDEAPASPTNTHRDTSTSTHINILENISTEGRSSGTEGHVNARLNSTETPGSGPGRNITVNDVKRARTLYNGFLRQADYNYYTLIVDSLRLILNIVATPLLVLAVVAFSRDKKISLSCKFVVSINAFDLISSGFNLVLSIMKYTAGPTHKWFVVWVIASNYCIVCCGRSVYGLNLLLSGQKLFAIASPLKSRYSRANTAGLVFLAGFPVYVFVCHIYLTLMYQVVEIAPKVFVMAETDIYKNNEELFNNLGHYSKAVLSYAPLAITLGVNLALLVLLKQHSEKVKDIAVNTSTAVVDVLASLRSESIRASTLASGRSGKDRQMTIMIVVSTLAYTVLSLPANVNQMLSSFFDAYRTNGQEHYLYSLIKNAANSAHILGSVSNFVTYLSLSSAFRQHVMTTLSLCRRTG